MTKTSFNFEKSIF